MALPALVLAASRDARAFSPEDGAIRAEPDRVHAASAERHHTFGMVMDVGVPDGAALGVSVRPFVEWLRVSAAGSYNGMAPGARVGMTLDPIAFPIAPTFTVEGGHYWSGPVPMVKDSVSVGYNYMNLHLGLEFGSQSSFRFFVRGGVSWLDISGTVNQQSNSSGSPSVSDPSFSGWVAPSGKLGFSTHF
jgi:hypothetical protein